MVHDVPGFSRAQAAYDNMEPPDTDDPPEVCTACGKRVFRDDDGREWCGCEEIDRRIDAEIERRRGWR